VRSARVVFLGHDAFEGLLSTDSRACRGAKREVRSRSRRPFEVETTTPQYVFASTARRKRERWDHDRPSSRQRGLPQP
jgi:hypothetical protein